MLVLHVGFQNFMRRKGLFNAKIFQFRSVFTMSLLALRKQKPDYEEKFFFYILNNSSIFLCSYFTLVKRIIWWFKLIFILLSEVSISLWQSFDPLMLQQSCSTFIFFYFWKLIIVNNVLHIQNLTSPHHTAAQKETFLAPSASQTKPGVHQGTDCCYGVLDSGLWPSLVTGTVVLY